jgi:hypothetical protein
VRRAQPTPLVLHAQKAPIDSRTLVIERRRATEGLAKRLAPTVKTPPRRAARLSAILRLMPGSDGGPQRERMLLALRTVGPVTSHEARHYLDIIHPAGRVMALRDDGHDILTRWVIQLSACGKPHRIGEWSLI